MPLDDPVPGVALHPRDEVNAVSGPGTEETVIVEASIHDHDGTGGQFQQSGNGPFVNGAFGQVCEDRQIAVVVKQQMQLDGTFSGAEVSPGKETQAQVNDSGVERQQFILEFEAPFLYIGSSPALFQHQQEQILIDFPGSVFVGVAKCRFTGRLLHSQVFEFTKAALQSIADFPQRMGLRQLTEEHGDELIPATEAFAVAISFVFTDDDLKFASIENSQNLRK